MRLVAKALKREHLSSNQYGLLRSQTSQIDVWVTCLIRYSPLRGPNEAMRHPARVKVRSRDRARWVDRDGSCAVDSTWDIERRDGAVARLQEAMRHPARVKVRSRDRARWVDAVRKDVLAPWDIERGIGRLRGS
jgi:hypothetical protein